MGRVMPSLERDLRIHYESPSNWPTRRYHSTMLIHDWLDRVAFSYLHCAIELKILPAPRALRPRCRLLGAEFGVPNPLNP